ncbi:MAG: rRNA maturation RNase YbeY [Burkholderiaceae bacterium]|nr:rRNA maturation RNase YbeY [Burkholderiaceae bacterium]
MSRPARTNTERAARRDPASRRSGTIAAAAADGTKPALSLAIQLGDGVRELPVSRAQLRRWVAAAIDADSSLTLRFVGEREARALNAKYRHRDYATNVLTFAYPAVAGRVNADIVICMPIVRREARAQRKETAAHLAHLVVHGVLHACGHDHELPDQAERMEAAEAALLARFRIADPRGPRG